MIVAIDAGHGYVKALSSRGQKVLFPSLICPAPATVDLGSFSTTHATLIDGTAYWVGEAARERAVPLWSRDKATDDTLRLILVAAVELGASGPVHLGAGLPLAWFGRQRKTFREALTGYGGTVKVAGQPERRVWFDQVQVLPQGVAAALLVLSKDTWNPGPYIVIDVGYRTTDYVVVVKRPTGKLDYDASHAGSIELGTHEIGNTMADTIGRDHQLRFQAAELETAEVVYSYGQPIELAPLRVRATETFRDRLRDKLAEVLDDHLVKTAGVILTGGGGALLASAFPLATVIPDGQWANSQAYLTALLPSVHQVMG